MVKHSIVITFTTLGNSKRVKKAVDEIAVASFVQVEGLTDDFGIRYEDADYKVKSEDKSYRLVHTFGNVICEGTREQCEFALKAITTYGIDDHKFDIEEV